MRDNHSRDHEIARAVAAGYSIQSLAQQYGLTPQRVHQIAQAAMLSKKPRTMRLGKDFIAYKLDKFGKKK